MPDAGCADAAYANSAPAGEAAASVEAASMKATEAEAVDEDRCRSVATSQLAFEHIDIEGQPVTLELGRLQHHNGITDCRPVGAEH